MSTYFDVPEDRLQKVEIDEKLIKQYISGSGKQKVFFKNGIPENYIDEAVDPSQFKNYSEAYHRLMYDLTLLNCESIELITDDDDRVKIIYVSGGFARNEIFVRLLAGFYPEKEVYTSAMDNSSALGAALVIWHAFKLNKTPEIDLGLKKWKAFN